MMETIGVSKLKVQQGQTFTITSHGNRIAMLVPVAPEIETSRNTLTDLRKTAHVGDVVSPINARWESIA